jgi:hypothetical protein
MSGQDKDWLSVLTLIHGKNSAIRECGGRGGAL